MLHHTPQLSEPASAGTGSTGVLAATDLFTQALHHEVEPRDDEDPEGGREDHPTKDRRAECDAACGSSARGEEQRHHAKDETQGGHQNRTEPQPRRLPSRFERRLALLPELVGELDDENRVLCRQTDQQDEADLGVDVVVEAPGQGQNRGAEDRHRHREDDAEGQGPTLVLGGQEEVDEDDGQREDEPCSTTGGELLVGHAGPLEAHRGRHRVAGDLLHRRDRLAGAVAGGGISGDRRRGVEVVAGLNCRADGVLDVDQGRQRDHPARVGANLELGDVGSFDPVGLVGLNHDLPDPAEDVEVVDIGRPEVGLQGVEDHRQGHVEALGLLAVHLEEELRHTGPERRVHGS